MTTKTEQRLTALEGTIADVASTLKLLANQRAGTDKPVSKSVVDKTDKYADNHPFGSYDVLKEYSNMITLRPSHTNPDRYFILQFSQNIGKEAWRSIKCADIRMFNRRYMVDRNNVKGLERIAKCGIHIPTKQEAKDMHKQAQKAWKEAGQTSS